MYETTQEYHEKYGCGTWGPWNTVNEKPYLHKFTTMPVEFNIIPEIVIKLDFDNLSILDSFSDLNLQKRTKKDYTKLLNNINLIVDWLNNKAVQVDKLIEETSNE